LPASFAAALFSAAEKHHRALLLFIWPFLMRHKFGTKRRLRKPGVDLNHSRRSTGKKAEGRTCPGVALSKQERPRRRVVHQLEFRLGVDSLPFAIAR